MGQRRVVGYVRVSTQEQVDGYGLDVQERAVRAYAKAQGFRVMAVYRDEGQSGSNGLDTREGLADALGAVRRGEVEGVIVPRLDRLARDLIVQEHLLRDIRRLGGELFSTSPSEAPFLVDDPDDPARKMIRQILGSVSEYERSMIALRLRGGRRRKAELGGYAAGRPPFGKVAQAGELVDDPTEQEVVKIVRSMRQSGASLRTIVDRLQTDGFTPKNGGQWHPNSVRRVVATAP